ncbi:hypothetical protein RDI58_028622 [Solanum bulbocastanum]
MPILGC